MIRAIIGNEEFTFDISTLRRIGRGGEGDVYLLDRGKQSYAVKIYYRPTEDHLKKIRAMLKNSPDDAVVTINSIAFIQLAWPVGICYEVNGTFCGFLMPYVDLSHSSTLDFYLDKRLYDEKFSHIPLSLTYRIEIARNLAGVIKSLHARQHYFIDFKPQNVRIYDRYHLISLIDCDGFSIAGIDGIRYPAKSFSSEYISPAALINNHEPRLLGLDQDLFALAVVIFQLLNYGIHPFSGLITNGDSATTTDEKVIKGYYPYGILVNPNIKPIKTSAHLMMSDELRVLFDRAFGQDIGLRPTVDEWISTLENILRNRLLVKCKNHPTDPEHIHFDGKECSACFRAGIVGRVKIKPQVSSAPLRTKKGSPWSISATPSNTSTYTSSYKAGQAVAKSGEIFGINKTFFLVGLFGILILVLALLFNSGTANNSNGVAAPAPPPRNVLSYIQGSWQLGSTCNEHYVTITPNSQDSTTGTFSHTYADSSKNNSSIIYYSERRPSDIVFINSQEGSYTYEIEYKKLNEKTLKLWRLTYYPTLDKANKTAYVLNGKELETANEAAVMEKCW